MTAWQFFGIFCISLVNGNAALAFVKILDGVVVLGRGELTKKVTVKAARVTKGAAQKIEAAGGKVEVI